MTAGTGGCCLPAGRSGAELGTRRAELEDRPSPRQAGVRAWSPQHACPQGSALSSRDPRGGWPSELASVTAGEPVQRGIWPGPNQGLPWRLGGPPSSLGAFGLVGAPGTPNRDSAGVFGSCGVS